MALAAGGELEEAVQRLDEAAATAPDDPQQVFLLATEYLWLKKVEAAERLFAQVVEARPIPQTHVLIGRAYRDAGEYDRARTELRAALTPREATAPTSPRFKDQVAETLSAIRKEEAVEKVRKQQEQRSARLDDDIARLQEWLELSPYQSNEMRTALLTQYEREDELRERWEQGEDEEVLGQAKRTAGETFRRDIERFLSEEQVETFWERVAERRK